MVGLLEQRYLHFDRLKLAFEIREGMLQHCLRADAERLEKLEPSSVGRRFIDRLQPSLKAQLCIMLTSSHHNAHDIDDGVRSGLLIV